MKSLDEFLKNQNMEKVINPCNLSNEDSEKLQQLLSDKSLEVWRIKTPCPNHRITIKNWNEASDDIKKQIKNILGE